MSDLHTDYEQLADSYDEDREKWSYPPDDFIGLMTSGGGRVSVLDLGCGTARWLETQAASFGSERVRFVGGDPAQGMLAYAVRKVPSASFVRTGAESLPFADGAFDYVCSGYCFHHFVDKDAALAETVRVLRPGGRFRMTNVEPYSLKRWWVFTFFDGTYENDMIRFWPPDRIASVLESLGCDVDVSVTVSEIEVAVAEVRADAERRVISQLAVLDDERYAAGLARLHALDDDTTVPSQGGSLTLTATRR